MTSMTPAEAAAYFRGLATAARATELEGRKVAARVVKRHIKATYGDADRLQSLASATQEERLKLGFSANDPGVRTGELIRDSIKIEHDAAGFSVGSDEPVAAYFEFGTVRQPPRPAIAIGATEALPEVEEICRATAAAMLGDRRSLEALAAAEVLDGADD